MITNFIVIYRLEFYIQRFKFDREVEQEICDSNLLKLFVLGDYNSFVALNLNNISIHIYF